MWFDERTEANAIAVKSDYDDIYDAAVAAFKRLRAALTSSVSQTATGGREKEVKGKPFGYNCPICGEAVDDSQPTTHTEQGLTHEFCCVEEEETGLSVGERCAEIMNKELLNLIDKDCPTLRRIAAIINQEAGALREANDNMFKIKQKVVVENVAMKKILGALQADKERLEKLYYELLYAVERKHDNETRHQAALRYIQQAEAHDKSQVGVGAIDAAMKQNLEERPRQKEKK